MTTSRRRCRGTGAAALLRRLASASLAIGALVVGGCAHENAAVTWDEAPAAPVQRAADPTAVDETNVAVRAAEARTSQECVAKATELHRTRRELAWSFMRACVRRDDFMDVLTLKSPPWNAHRFERSDLPALIQASLRHGAFDPSEDLVALHMGVTPYEAFREGGSDAKRAPLVLLRVKVLRHYLRGKSWISVVEPLSVQDAGTSYGYGRYRSYYPSYRGERRERPMGPPVVVHHDGAQLPEGGKFVLIAEPKPAKDGKVEQVLVENDAEAELRFVVAVPVAP